MTIDVGAGYDIISFDSKDSTEYDRFIEVKAINRDSAFFFSSNELEIVRVKSKNYYLYRVNLNQIGKPDYCPVVICDPAETIFMSDNWIIETKSYYIRKI